MPVLIALLMLYVFTKLLLGNFVKMNNVVPGGKSYVQHHTAAPVNGTDEVWTFTGGATAGTFKISHGGYKTSTLNWNSTATQIRDAIRALPHIGSAGVTSSGGPLNTTPVVITAAARMGRKNIGIPTITDNTATGGTITVARTTPGVDATQRNAPEGSILVDDSTGVVYVNTGTNPQQTWTKVGVQT